MGAEFWLSLICGLSTAWFPPSDKPSSPAALRVERKILMRTITLTGDLEAVEKTAVVAPSLMYQGSYAISCLVPEGSQVEPGQVLVPLDGTE